MMLSLKALSPCLTVKKEPRKQYSTCPESPVVTSSASRVVGCWFDPWPRYTKGDKNGTGRVAQQVYTFVFLQGFGHDPPSST